MVRASTRACTPVRSWLPSPLIRPSSHPPVPRPQTFVSTVEGRNYPVTATQWHPERPQFEWKLSMNLNHSEEAVRAMAWLANYFVSQARRSPQRFDTPEKQALAIKYSVYGMTATPYSSDPLTGYFKYAFTA